MRDDIDRFLLDRIQDRFPIDRRPFARLAEQAGLTEAEVIDRLVRLKQPPKPVIRQISAIFDSAALGYTSTLVAARVDPDGIEQAAATISQHPGVTHNYQRNHDYNLWYTLTLPPDSALGIDKTLQLLHRLSGAQATRPMPALRLFKIGVKFDMGNEPDAASGRTETGPAKPAATNEEDQAPSSPARAPTPTAPFQPTDRNRALVRALQQDLPLVPQPFDALAEEAGIAAEPLIAAITTFQANGWMRRYAAVLHHRQAGFHANAMGVWIVPPQDLERIGAIAAGFSAVSHCYQRPTWPDWPYNLYTMVHAPDRPGCEAILADISTATGITQYRALYSTREFKKKRMKYFTGEVEQWESRASA